MPEDNAEAGKLMDLAEIPEVLFDESGVIYQYLVLRLSVNGQEKTLIRGANYRPYESGAAQRIINRAWDELEAAGFHEGRDELLLEGGGTLSFNPYYETATLFGGAGESGAEANREETARILERAFPGYRVEFFGLEPEEPEKPVQKNPPKAVSESAEAES